MNSWIARLPADKVAEWLAKNGDKAMARYYTTDPVFALWMYYVDRAVQRRIVVGCMDLEDWRYRDAYDDDMSPKEAAIELLEDLGYADAYEGEE